jgi:amidase
MTHSARRLIGTLIVGTLLSACSPSGPDISKTDDRNINPGNYAAVGWTAKTLPELSAALQTADVSAETLVREYLTRIDAIDRAGPDLQSVLSLNPNALEEAQAIDRRRADGETLGPLAGIPVLLKDNIETLDNMPTTAGAFALENNMTGRDSPLASGLRSQGAIILGKTNLSQWANFRSEYSISGWSAIGGQVRNPHMLDRSPCGSSSGSGAAIAASLAAGAVGTETNGSIICPSNVNGIVGFKPTVGLVPQKYIVPISLSQDTAGPMTKTVTGSAMMLSAMATTDTGTPLGHDYVSGLSDTSLGGTRVGVMRFSQGSNPDIVSQFDAALSVLESQGAVLVDIEEFSPDTENFGRKSYDVLLYEFKDGLNHYLQDAAQGVSPRTLKQVIAFNETHDGELAVFDQSIFELAQAKGPLTDEEYITARDDVQRVSGADGLDKLMAEHNVAVLVGPSGPIASRVDPVNGDVWPAWAGSGGYAAKAGYPHLTVPMGAVHGLPIGLSFMAGKDQDAAVLSYGYDYEQASQMRVEPSYLSSAEDRPEIKAAMER